MITPIHDRIIFAFVDDVYRGMFEDVSTGGIIIGRNKELSGKTPRWGIVLVTGPEVKNPELVKGTAVLIEELRWSDAVMYENRKVWITTEKDIIIIDDRPHPNAQAIMDQYKHVTD